MSSNRPEAEATSGLPSIRVYSTPEEREKAIAELYENFPGGGLEGVLPPHFIEATFPKIGGRIFQLNNGVSNDWGLIMPTHRSLDQDHDWTLRMLWKSVPPQEQQVKLDKMRRYFSDSNLGDVIVYDVFQKRQEPFSGQVFRHDSDGTTLATPDSEQAKEAQELQRLIWNVADPAFLYPFDLYRSDSGLATRLVAVDTSKVVGFLFGFYGKGLQWFGTQEGFREGYWVESQLMGIKSTHRRTGIAKQLKLLQREMSMSEGIDIIHWTVDPLQAGNAFLNFNTLGGVAAQHYEDYYPFRNALNLVKASRIGVSWALRSPRVSACAEGDVLSFDYERLIGDSNVEVIEPLKLSFDPAKWTPMGDQILLEIPLDWNSVQKNDLETAKVWRDKTDTILKTILGKNAVCYVISGVVKNTDQERVFLVIEKATSKLGI